METTVTMYTAVTAALTQIITWVGDVLDAIMTGALADLLPLLAVGIGISLVFLAVKVFKSFAWGT